MNDPFYNGNPMNDLRVAIRRFWGSFTNLQGIPFSDLLRSPTNPFGAVFQDTDAEIRDAQNRVIPAPLPYITYDISLQQFGAQTMITGEIWNRIQGQRGNMELVDHVLGQFQQKFKNGAVTLDIGNLGGIILRFQSARPFPRPDPSAPDITRGVMQMWTKDFIV